MAPYGGTVEFIELLTDYRKQKRKEVLEGQLPLWAKTDSDRTDRDRVNLRLL